MRMALAVFVMILAVSVSAKAKSDADRTAIKNVISGQIDAFRRDDANSAYSFAAPSIQRLFPSPEVFMNMVRSGYSVVYRPQSYEFGLLDFARGKWLQPVSLIGPRGRPMDAIYVMEQQPGGEWKIACVFLMKSQGESA